MCSQDQSEVEAIRKELIKAGIQVETRPHPIAEAFGVSGLELWVQNERDFFNASKLYARLQDRVGESSAPSTTRPPAKALIRSGNEAQTKARSSPREGSQTDPKPVPQSGRMELKQASTLLQKGIEEVLLRESQLSGECAALRGKVQELTQALAQAQTQASREIKNREAAERTQTEELTHLLNTLDRERKEWEQQLKACEDSMKKAQDQAHALSHLVQSQQAASVALKREITGLEVQRDQQEQLLNNARQETMVEREARLAAEQRAGAAEESLQAQWAERINLETQIRAQLASLGSLVGKLASKASGDVVA
jgi:chromosome segregation ATPase